VDVSAWLCDLGLERYVAAFLDAEVTTESLLELTDGDLRELGLPLGPRRIALRAIRHLARPSGANTRSAEADDVRLRASPPSPAERRVITVMFIDLVRSTAVSTRLDPEDFRELIRCYHAHATVAVERVGGFVAKYMGDGVLAYFGYPRAHEDDPERAIRAGLELTGSIQSVDTPAGTGLKIRVGIATGEAVVGELPGRGEAEEWAVLGETPNLAARLQAIADPSSVVIAEATRRLVGGLFDCRDLGPVHAKGFPERVRAYRIHPSRAVTNRFEALHAGPAPLVGRDEQMRILLGCWELALKGDGQVVLISGEAGVGKSRLLVALQEALQVQSHALVRISCSPWGENSPFYPLIANLEQAACFSPDDAPEVRRAKLGAV